MKLKIFHVKDKLDRLLGLYADYMGEIETHRVLANHYTALLLDVDPNEDWWRFAELKQKQYDHQTEHTIYTKRAEDALRKVNEVSGRQIGAPPRGAGVEEVADEEGVRGSVRP